MIDTIGNSPEHQANVSAALEIGKRAAYMATLMEKSGAGKHLSDAGVDPSFDGKSVTLNSNVHGKGVAYSKYDSPDNSYSSETIINDDTFDGTTTGTAGTRVYEGNDEGYIASQKGNAVTAEVATEIASSGAAALNDAIETAKQAAIAAQDQRPAA